MCSSDLRLEQRVLKASVEVPALETEICPLRSKSFVDFQSRPRTRGPGIARARVTANELVDVMAQLKMTVTLEIFITLRAAYIYTASDCKELELGA